MRRGQRGDRGGGRGEDRGGKEEAGGGKKRGRKGKYRSMRVSWKGGFSEDEVHFASRCKCLFACGAI